jgi:hypothetical protein
LFQVQSLWKKRGKQMKVSILFLALAGLLLPMAGLASPAAGQELTTPAQLSRTVDLRNVNADANGTVSGTLVNRSDYTLLEVKLQVDYAWVWRNDFKPGEDNPGRTVYFTAPAQIPPHGESSFSYQPSPPLAASGDGHFVPTVSIVGFKQIGE